VLIWLLTEISWRVSPKSLNDKEVNIILQFCGTSKASIEFGKYTSEATATIIISTIHKAKGREWDNVILCDDFPIFQHCECFKEALRTSREEFNLLYVGVTRAKKQLMLEKGTRNFISRIDSYVNSQNEKDKPEEIQ
jgi:superfamily I DNA/RNA helicase